MADLSGLRRWQTREYLRQHAANRRADAKADGARRIDVTLRGEDLDDFEQVKRWLDGVNRLAAERSFTTPDGTRHVIPPGRLSDAEIIRQALRFATAWIEQEENE